jgi:hypothetical protein
MRIAGQTKLGYYPTPTEQTRLISTWLKTDGGPLGVRLLDPCAGQGEALEGIALAQGGGETYGIELSDVRSEEAKKHLHSVLNTGFEYAVLTRGAFSAVFLNPPYDGETITGGGQRLEETFLRDTTPLLIQEGVLIYIIPHIRITEVVARHLAGWYKDLRCFKFAGYDFEDFNQVIIIGTKTSYRPPADRRVAEIQAWADLQVVTGWKETGKDDDPAPITAPLPAISAGNGEYLIKPAPERGDNNQVFRFKFQPITNDDYMRLAIDAANRLNSGRAWTELRPPLEKEPITPAISPRQGHIAMQVTGGVLGTNKINHNGKPMLLKGSLRKKTLLIQRGEIVQVLEGGLNELDDNDKKHLKRVEIEEKFEPVITTLTQEGEIKVVDEPNEVTEILKTHVGELVDIVEERNVPLYRYDPTEEEWEAVSALSQGRAWPGQPPGFSEPQKHTIIAAARTLRARNTIFQVVEMGGGKTRTGTATVELLHQYGERQGKQASIAYPVLVAAPGMVTSDSANWVEEIPQIVPGAVARTVRVTARPVPKPARIIDWLKRMAEAQWKVFSLDEEGQTGKDAAAVYQAVREALEKSGVVLSEPALKALRCSLHDAAKTAPTKRTSAKAPNLLDGRIGGLLWMELGNLMRDENHVAEIQDKPSLAGFVADYKAGRLPEKAFAVLSYETAKLGPGRVPSYMTRPWIFRVYDRATEQDINEVRMVPACPHCGMPIAEMYSHKEGSGFGLPYQDEIISLSEMEEWSAGRRQFCQAPHPHRVWKAEEEWTDAKGVRHTGKHEEALLDEEGHPYVCGAPLFEYSGLRRVSGTTYLAGKAKGFFKTTILDELHKAKSKGTGVGHVMAVLAGATKYKIGLTGTLFGGISTSIFWLLYRILSTVRQQYGFDAEMEWAEQMGLIKRTFYVDEHATVPDDGAYTGRKFFETVDERPGISPNIAKYILPICIFASLQDMGLPLPPYDKEVVRLNMTPSMKAQYEALDGSQNEPPSGLFKWALEEKKRPDGTGRGAIGVWWSAIFNRPNAMFRAEQVIFNRRISGKGRFAKRVPEVVASVPAVHSGSLLPKEEWLLSTIKAQLAAGRKSIVYVRQTGERDIQEHLAEIFTKAGIRVEIMSPAIQPNKRIDWLKKNIGKFDVLITNPRLVEVGLNLTMLPTAIFYEIDPSFYTLYQAMKRVFRPFAPKPVQVYFAVYNDTAEATILDVMGEKFLSNQLLTGQEIGSALVPDDAGSVLQVAIYRTMNHVRTKQVTGLFGS